MQTELLEKIIPAVCYSPTTCCCSTIAAENLNDRVRDENGCVLLAMTTGKWASVYQDREKMKLHSTGIPPIKKYGI